MKKILILLVAIVFLAACNNNKTKGGGLFGGLGGANKGTNTNNSRNKDDYNNNRNTSDNNDRNKDDNNMNNNNRGGGWTNSDRNEFLNQCKTELNNPELANSLCPCVMEKLEKEFTDLNDLNQRGTEAEGSRLSQECLAGNNNNNDNYDRNKDDNGNNGGNENNGGNSNWTKSDRRNFVDICSTAAQKNGLTERQAQNYCSCMQEKLEKKYPDARNANGADMNSSDMKEMARDCMASDNQ